MGLLPFRDIKSRRASKNNVLAQLSNLFIRKIRLSFNNAENKLTSTNRNPTRPETILHHWSYRSEFAKYTRNVKTIVPELILERPGIELTSEPSRVTILTVMIIIELSWSAQKVIMESEGLTIPAFLHQAMHEYMRSGHRQPRKTYIPNAWISSVKAFMPDGNRVLSVSSVMYNWRWYREQSSTSDTYAQ